MKRKVLVIIGVIFVIFISLGLFTSYKDSARVRNGIEPKYVIKLVNKSGSKVTYYGLGYKVIRYVSVSPSEPYKNNIGVKYGNWFMKYDLEEKETISVKILDSGKNVEISNKEDVNFIINIFENSKYINEECDGINTHEIIIKNKKYYLKKSCMEIQKGNKQAKISEEDLNRFLKIIDDNNVIINDDEVHTFIGL